MFKKIIIVSNNKDLIVNNFIEDNKKYNYHYDFEIVNIDSDNITDEDVENFKKTLENFKPDIVHFQCYKLASKLARLVNSKKILTFHSKDIDVLGFANWFELGIDHIITHTNKSAYLLVEKFLYPNDRVSVINYGVDLDKFKYNKEIVNNGIIGYCGDIYCWRNLDKILRVAKKLNKKVIVIGNIKDNRYWEEILENGLDKYADFSFFDCSEEERIVAYESMEVFVNYTNNNYEEGPMSCLEAMSTGVPVITTKSGMMREIAVDNENCLLVDFRKDETLENSLNKIFANTSLKDKLKTGGWDTVKNFSNQKEIREYDIIYQRVLCGEKDLASVIIPTFNKWSKLRKILLSLNEQTYKNFEVVVADDNSDLDNIKLSLESLRNSLLFPVKYINTFKDGYNLAMARNMGAIESVGETLIFIDNRIMPESDSIEKFVFKQKNNHNKIWFFGNKGSDKKTFVENFSAVRRDDFINFGMFSERIDKYGGLSEETRKRWSGQDGIFKYCESIYSKEIDRADKRDKRMDDISEMKLKISKMYGKVYTGYDRSLKYND